MFGKLANFDFWLAIESRLEQEVKERSLCRNASSIVTFVLMTSRIHNGAVAFIAKCGSISYSCSFISYARKCVGVEAIGMIGVVTDNRSAGQPTTFSCYTVEIGRNINMFRTISNGIIHIQIHHLHYGIACDRQIVFIGRCSPRVTAVTICIGRIALKIFDPAVITEEV